MSATELHIQDGHGRVTTLAMGDKPVTIGRDGRNAACITDSQASRQHCVLVRVGQAVHVIDLDSRNGIRVNGVPTSMAQLRPGDILEIGHTRITLAAVHGGAAPKPMPIPYPRPIPADPAKKTGPLDAGDVNDSTYDNRPSSSTFSG